MLGKAEAHPSDRLDFDIFCSDRPVDLVDGHPVLVLIQPGGAADPVYCIPSALDSLIGSVKQNDVMRHWLLLLFPGGCFPKHPHGGIP